MKTRSKKILLLVTAFSLIALLIILIILWLNQNNENVRCSEDQYSGDTVCTTDYEAEVSEDTPTIFLGLAFLDDNGFSNTQQDAILSYLKSHFSDYKSMSYLKNSFNYDPVTVDGEENFSKSHFTMVSDTSETFIIRLDTKNSIATVSISAEKTN